MATKQLTRRAARGRARPKASRQKQKPKPTVDKIASEEAHPREREALPDFNIVGIGASAGGLEAASQLLHALPENIDFAIVIVQHLSPGHESFLAGLLGGSTSLPVESVTDRVHVEPGKVYVLPPNAHIEIADGMLRLVPRPTDRTQYMPVDHFFSSLAAYAQSRAIGVILSGTASDGALGAREIKAAGGITFAQDPQSARYEGMPRSAIATGIVDLVLPPEQIAAELLRICRHPNVLSATLARTQQPTQAIEANDQDLLKVFMLLRNTSGVDFRQYKLPTIQRRLHRRMVLHKIESLSHYVRFLQSNPGEINSLYQDILIHVTRFFRDGESFQALVDTVFPPIIENRTRDAALRVWVPGCSTGEEAYSIAIALFEALGESAAGIPIQIFATDVSEAAIESARAGVYPENISGDVSPERLRRFFTRLDGNYRVTKQVRDSCIFARQDLTRDPPFSKLDLIVCRNVMIYLGSVLQRRLMSVFHYALKSNGYLMLGSAESVGAHTDFFHVVDKRHKIYSKKPTVLRPHVELPFEYSRPPIEQPKGLLTETRAGHNIQAEANRVLLTRYSPPGVLVDSDLKIIQFRGQTGPYLEPAPGEASLDLLKMAREGLLHALRGALTEARKKNTPVRRDGLHIKSNGNVRHVNLQVIPVSIREERYFLVLFETSGKLPDRQAAVAKRRSHKAVQTSRRSAATERMAHLERELASSREYLQSVIQDLEAANEEMQSANEEILSANEELQSTNEELDTAKEELQSANEELNTVSEDLQGRKDELSRVNSDLINLLGSVQIAIVMVTQDLRIRRFTPMAEKILNLIPTDVGRPISDIKPNIDCPELEELITEAVDTVSNKERQCRDGNGNTYLLRVRPYKNVENRIDGAVLALFDTAGEPRPLETAAPRE